MTEEPKSKDCQTETATSLARRVQAFVDRLEQILDRGSSDANRVVEAREFLKKQVIPSVITMAERVELCETMCLESALSSELKHVRYYAGLLRDDDYDVERDEERRVRSDESDSARAEYS